MGTIQKSTNNSYRFVFEKYNGHNRYECPQCGDKKSFVRYIDTHGSCQLPNHVGKCENKNICGYWFTVGDFFKNEPFNKPVFVAPKFKYQSTQVIDYMDFDLVVSSCKGYQNNNFVQYLIRRFGNEKALTVVNTYNIGTSKRFTNATIFWQIDRWGKVRTGKIIPYYANTGKRVKRDFTKYDKERIPYKEKNGLISWVHRECEQYKTMNFKYKQCLFGEHLVERSKDKRIAIVESEKTAIIMSLLFPDYLWLACGSMANISVNFLENIRDKALYLFPDLQGLSEWQKKAQRLNEVGYSITVFDELEKIATEAEIAQKLDIADFFTGNNIETEREINLASLVNLFPQKVNIEKLFKQ